MPQVVKVTLLEKNNWLPFSFGFKLSGGADFFNKIYSDQKVPLVAAVLALFLAFGGGVWTALTTSKSQAEDQPLVPLVLALQTSQPINPLTVANTPVSSQHANGISNQVLFNMTMSQLENYFSQLAESDSRVQAEQLLADRKAKLKIYLQEKNSPLVEIVDSLAELKHWKLVLAISNSESSLGKHCYNNNCSGIGVAPDHPLWRDYASKREWAKDLDKLIEKRYSDWSLEEMNGVYNKPGSENWVAASTQILEELSQRGIE